MMFIMMYVDGKTTRETLSILLTEFRAFSESQIALVTHLKYKNMYLLRLRFKQFYTEWTMGYEQDKYFASDSVTFAFSLLTKFNSLCSYPWIRGCFEPISHAYLTFSEFFYLLHVHWSLSLLFSEY